MRSSSCVLGRSFTETSGPDSYLQKNPDDPFFLVYEQCPLKSSSYSYKGEKKEGEIYFYAEQDYKGHASLKSHREKLNRCLGLELTLYTEHFNVRLQNGSGRGGEGLFIF